MNTIIPNEVWIGKIIYPEQCLSWFFVNKRSYDQSQHFISFLFENIMKQCESGSMTLKVEFKEQKIFIDNEVFGPIKLLRITDLFRLSTLIQGSFESQGFFSIQWGNQTIVHHSQFMHAQNKAKESLEALLIAWPTMRDALSKDSPIGTLPAENASINEIRAFFENPKNADYLNKVWLLDLAELGLTITPFGLNQFKNLERLLLNDNALTSVPYLNLPKLKKLNLQNNSLSWLPRYFTGCPSLDTLNLAKNKIKVCNSDFSLCQQLRILQINECELEEFTPNLRCCTNLTFVKLENNRLKYLSTDFSKCLKLRDLNVANNQLSRFESDLNDCYELRTLNLTGNPLLMFDRSLISMCKQLELEM